MAKILVVDDEKIIVKGIRFSLLQDQMEVDCAYDGEQAVEMARNTEYDVVLLDVMLPKLDGFQVCQAIREFSNMPIIMLTAKGDDMDKILVLNMVQMIMLQSHLIFLKLKHASRPLCEEVAIL